MRKQVLSALLILYTVMLCACSVKEEGPIVGSSGADYPSTDISEEQESQINSNITIVGPTGRDSYYIAIENSTNLYGIYDTADSSWILEPTLLYIDTYDLAGMAMAQQGDYYGYIDQKGNTVIGFQFSEAQSFNDRDFAPVRMNHVGVIDRVGNFIIEPMYDGISYNSDFIKVYNGKYGLYNCAGDLIIAPEYDDDFIIDEQFIYTKIYHNDFGDWYTVFDHSGNELLNSIPFDNVRYISYPKNGIHLVCCDMRTGWSEPTQYYCIADMELNPVSDQKFAYISEFSSSGYAAAVSRSFYPEDAYGRLGTKDGEWYIINLAGEKVSDLPSNIPSFSNSNGTFYHDVYYYVNNYWGLAKEVSGYGDKLYSVNIQSKEIQHWKTIEEFDGTNCIIAQNESTGLWTLFDGDVIVDSTCTEIIFDGDSFQLIHGGESEKYNPIDRG